ncbi:MAG: hypothetical protein C4576_19375 [Desulfobacteraceae bacterium]|nr:MAG: hypothetical protein C4576_19375 [Desulfobacteraceae bacterium]
MRGQGSGLTVKFDSRGRTYKQKDFREMPDDKLMNKVVVFADYLPWKDGDNRQHVLEYLCLAARRIGDREAKKAEPQEQSNPGAQNAKPKVKEPGEFDSYIHFGSCYYVGTEIKREPLYLRYRETKMCLNLLVQALGQMPITESEKNQALKGLKALRAGVTAKAFEQMDGDEKGFKIDISEIDEIGKMYAPDPTPAKMNGRGQGSKKKNPSARIRNFRKRAA